MTQDRLLGINSNPEEREKQTVVVLNLLDVKTAISDDRAKKKLAAANTLDPSKQLVFEERLPKLRDEYFQAQARVGEEFLLQGYLPEPNKAKSHHIFNSVVEALPSLDTSGIRSFYLVTLESPELKLWSWGLIAETYKHMTPKDHTALDSFSKNVGLPLVVNSTR